MANSAPYQVDITGSDDETFSFSLTWVQDDGSPFPWADYDIAYSIRPQDCPRGGGFTLGQVLSGTEGVFVDTGSGTVAFEKSQGSLRPGAYEHGCRIKHKTTGKLIQVFDGTVTIAEGHFS